MIYFNADIGEGAGFDKELMPYLEYCNIACGGHAGDDVQMKNCIEMAIEQNVKIGAHPSYPDPENFGRISMDISHEDLLSSIKDQIHRLQVHCNKLGVKLHHVKAHGALYNDASDKREIMEILVQAIKEQAPEAKIMLPYGSLWTEWARSQMPVINEVFADRNYNNDYTLVSRKLDNACIENPLEVEKHLRHILEQGKVKCIDESELPVEYDCFCVHGDNPNSLSILSHLKKQL